jgi:enoyl-CoA hydratase/carnithine racemase
MNLKTVIYEKIDGVAKVTLNRPELLNAMDHQMRTELLDVINDFSHDARIRVVTITGAGRAFCAGTDVSDLKDSGSFPPSEDILFRRITRSMEKSPMPIVAVINGFALGGGLEFALACDFRLAMEGVEMGLPEVGIGLIPGAGGTQRLPRIVGVAKAKELIFLGKKITAEEALRIGLVNAVAPSKEFSDLVSKWTSEIKSKSPVSIASSKFSINSFYEGSRLDEGLALEAEYARLNFESLDREEGLQALKEKRAPKFRGF